VPNDRPYGAPARAVRLSLLAAAIAVAGALPARAELLDGTRVASIDPPAQAETPAEKPHEFVLARVDLSDQKMYVYVDEKLEHVFPISSGRGSYHTPTGQWKAAWLSRYHRSKKYNNAPMPYSVFFYRGYAVHGTTDIKHLGSPASHGCIRLHPDNAKIFFTLVQENGKDSTLISVVR
jgi:lipoprotein-anchoring transpeptidase ErfK/SrfK